jgi:beta-glucosidase
MNEPEEYVFHGWLRGIFPPGKADVNLALKVYVNVMKGHAEAYHAIKEADLIDADGDGRPAQVGVAKLLVPVEPAVPWDPPAQAAAAYLGDFSNAYWLVADQTGVLAPGLPALGVPAVEYPRFKGSHDFVGVNYYSRQIVRIDPLRGLLVENPIGSLVSELDIELFPRGLYQSLEFTSRFGLPILITENGIADSQDALRARFIVDHLSEVARFMRDHPDASVLGYVHWALMDNFEWENGFRPRFGLYAVDYATQARTRRASASVFAELIARVKQARE